MDSKTTIQCNKLMPLEDSIVMYGIYNAETLEQLINTVHHTHSPTPSNEKTVCRTARHSNTTILTHKCTRHTHYSINSMLYLRTVQDEHVLLYKEFIMQLHIYATAIRILSKGYLPVSLITPSKLKEILNKLRNMVRKTNPDYDLVIKRLHLYYDMKLVTFSIDNNKNLIVQFPVFTQPYTQQSLILYQIETVPIKNCKFDSYYNTHHSYCTRWWK